MEITETLTETSTLSTDTSPRVKRSEQVEKIRRMTEFKQEDSKGSDRYRIRRSTLYGDELFKPSTYMQDKVPKWVDALLTYTPLVLIRPLVYAFNPRLKREAEAEEVIDTGLSKFSTSKQHDLDALWREMMFKAMAMMKRETVKHEMSSISTLQFPPGMKYPTENDEEEEVKVEHYPFIPQQQQQLAGDKDDDDNQSAEEIQAADVKRRVLDLFFFNRRD